MLVNVKVTPGARKEAIEETKPHYFKVSVKQKAERGQANKRVIELVAKHFNIPREGVRIVSGRTSPKKIFKIME